MNLEVSFHFCRSRCKRYAFGAGSQEKINARQSCNNLILVAKTFGVSISRFGKVHTATWQNRYPLVNSPNISSCVWFSEG